MPEPIPAAAAIMTITIYMITPSNDETAATIAQVAAFLEESLAS